MAAYLVIDTTVHDADVYAQYVAAVRPVIASYGGEHLVSSDNVVPFSGGWEPSRMVIIRFPSAEKLKACFASEEYTAIKHLREASCAGRTVMVVDGDDGEVL